MEFERGFMDMSGRFTANSCPDYARLVTVCDADVSQTMLERSLDRPFSKHAINIIPLVVILVNAINMPDPAITYKLVAAQFLAIIGAAIAANTLLNAYRKDKDGRILHLLWLFMEGLSGAIWGLMLYTISGPVLTGHVFSVVAVTVCGTIIAGTIKSSTTLNASKVQIFGFALTSIPIALIYYNNFGLTVVIALIAMPIAVTLTAKHACEENANGIRTEMENGLLASHLADALQVADFMSRHDSLTNLLNRRELAEQAKSLRSEHPDRDIMVMLLDLDHFKKVNDMFGHAIGDSALRYTANALRSVIGDEDEASSDSHALARWGGEEFVILLADISTDKAAILGKQIRQQLVGHHEPDWPEEMAITASIGSAKWLPNEPLDDAIAKADKAMYDAKNKGRNAFVHQNG
jgi:diguanylate cyclase (GGDEF)-like protein